MYMNFYGNKRLCLMYIFFFCMHAEYDLRNPKLVISKAWRRFEAGGLEIRPVRGRQYCEVIERTIEGT